MKRATLGLLVYWLAAGVVIVLLTLWAARVSQGAISDCIDATCRITAADGGRGSGCVFEISRGRVYVLTAAHVVEQAETVQCEFWTQGHQSAPLPGRVILRSAAADAAVVALEAGQFAGRLPKAVPLAGQNWTARPGETLTSVGCANGSWSTGWKGHVLRCQGGDLRFMPTPANGRSGSALFDAEGTKIVGIVRARDEANAEGIATSVQGLNQPWQTGDPTAARNGVAQSGPWIRCLVCRRNYECRQCPLEGGRPHCPRCTALCAPAVDLVQCAPRGVPCGPGDSGVPEWPHLLPYRNREAQREQCGPDGCGIPEWPHLLPYRKREAERERTPQPGPGTPWPTLPANPAPAPTPDLGEFSRAAAPAVDLGPVIQRLDAIAAGQGQIIDELRSAARPPAEVKPSADTKPAEPPVDQQARQGVDAALKAIDAVHAQAKQGIDQAGKLIAEVQKGVTDASVIAKDADNLASDAKKLAGEALARHDKLFELIQQHGSLFERIEMRRQAVEEKLGENAGKFAEVREFAKSLVQDKLAQGAPGVLSLIGIGGVPALVVGVLIFLIMRDVRQKITTGDPLLIEKAFHSAQGFRDSILRGHLLSTLHDKVSDLAGRVEAVAGGALGSAAPTAGAASAGAAPAVPVAKPQAAQAATPPTP